MNSVTYITECKKNMIQFIIHVVWYMCSGSIPISFQAAYWSDQTSAENEPQWSPNPRIIIQVWFLYSIIDPSRLDNFVEIPIHPSWSVQMCTNRQQTIWVHSWFAHAYATTSIEKGCCRRNGHRNALRWAQDDLYALLPAQDDLTIF